ncbi:hypothetical protein DM01DRAFT_1336337 [Hesseltinella vesiculosa]|uniref:Transcription factor domain-containing protein n=1 Tax=Hesseltinella vesiculosa TaxID=101127 RepID=A0A1X2GG92_9FUNG|nr:hypothetical protein DM01DRAFT_1336337 [Hesseltinella vesiculosa]
MTLTTCDFPSLSPLFDRCVKFNVDCVYTILTSPSDEEYLKQIKYLEAIGQLEEQLDAMQQEMDILQLDNTNSQLSLDTTSSSLLLLSSIVTSTASNPFSSTTTVATDTRMVKRQRTAQGLVATVARYLPNPASEATSPRQQTHDRPPEKYQWDMKISKNGTMVIQTNIKSHTELLDCLCNGIRTIQQPEFVPRFWDNYRPKNPILSHVMQIYVWKRYGRSRLKGMYLSCSPKHSHQHTSPDVSPDDTHRIADVFANPSSLASLTSQIFDAYADCINLDLLNIHVPTFRRFFVTPAHERKKKGPLSTSAFTMLSSPPSSPPDPPLKPVSSALLALCAIACTTTCKHFYQAVPPHQREHLGKLFADKARALVADMFDEPTLETLATFVLLAYYKHRRSQGPDFEFLVSMAERLSPLVKEQLPAKPPVCDDQPPWATEAQGEWTLYERLDFQLSKISTIVSLHCVRRKMLRKGYADQSDRSIVNKFHDHHYPLSPAHDDSEAVRRHILYHGYLRQLNKDCHEAAHHAPADNTGEYVGIVGHMIEMSMRRWYASIPNSFKLDLPLFEYYGPDLLTSSASQQPTSRWLQLFEDAPDAIPLLSTLNIYNEYMLMAIAHISRTPADLETCEAIATYWKEHYLHVDYDFLTRQWGDKWCQRVKKMEKMLQGKIEMMQSHCLLAHDLGDDTNSSNPELANLPISTAALVTLLTSAYSGFNDPSARIAVYSALNAVQILQFLRLRHLCLFDLRVANNVWTILLRALKFGFGNKDMRTLLQANLICCLSMVRDEIHWLPNRPSMVDFVKDMEQEYKEEFGIA